jgi:hypothetical protein
LWQQAGAVLPPPHALKRITIKEYADKFGIQTLIETGTYLGHMVEAQQFNFKKIVSIELSEELWAGAVEKFRRYPHITIVQGDSSHVLPKVMADVKGPALFWLDGHYSAGVTAKGEKYCPIYAELDAIFDNSPQPHVILVDDARHFEGKDDYPTIQELANYIKGKNPKYTVEVKDDIIRGTVPE